MEIIYGLHILEKEMAPFKEVAVFTALLKKKKNQTHLCTLLSSKLFPSPATKKKKKKNHKNC